MLEYSRVPSTKRQWNEGMADGAVPCERKGASSSSSTAGTDSLTVDHRIGFRNDAHGPDGSELVHASAQDSNAGAWRRKTIPAWPSRLLADKTSYVGEEALSRIRPLILRDEIFRDLEGNAVALLGQVKFGLAQEDVKALVGQSETVVMSALDWQIMTAENMVAAFQDTNTTLFATALNALEARLYFEALEKGTDGVVLQTEDPTEIFSLKAYLASRTEEENKIGLQVGTVIRVEVIGMGDRVCVDLCNLMIPGEGLLVGSFARGLFLVHSECLTSDYVASRPFRVNAGPVHAYVAVPGGRTSYLAELRSGSEVLAVNSDGRTRSVTVGRVKIESRPLMLVEVEFEGSTYSLLLQNVETVCLISPSASDVQVGQGTGETAALPVTRMKVGDKVIISLQGGARHTGLQIDEFIVEK